jgi:RNA polymerase sigma-70 factor (ECF subfamily)
MPSSLFQSLLTAAHDTGVAIQGPVHDELQRRLVAAEAANPGLAGDPYEYCVALLTLVSAAPDPLAELAKLHVEDMYFVWALAKQERAAVLRFEREFLLRLPGRVAEAHEFVPGELEQHVRTRLLVGERAGDGVQAPRITQYAGRGPFSAWLRMVAKRVALDLLRARGKARTERELESPGVATDPELDFLKLRHAADFKSALEQALSALTARQVTLLKLSYLEQLSPSAIGVMYGVSNRTVQRWLADLKDDVLRRVRAGLKERLALSPSELDSLLRLMQSQLQVSLHRVLGSGWAR